MDFLTRNETHRVGISISGIGAEVWSTLINIPSDNSSLIGPTRS
jgi:hypothetical protein